MVSYGRFCSWPSKPRAANLTGVLSSLAFLKRFYLFIFRERREGERVGEEDGCVRDALICISRAPHRGPDNYCSAHAVQVCPVGAERVFWVLFFFSKGWEKVKVC